LANKKFILDTSVLLYHEDSIHGFPNLDVIIPIEVLEELDNAKLKNDSIGNSARYINRFLDDLRSRGSLSDGVLLDNGQTITVCSSSDMSILPGGMIDSVDNRIISVAKIYSEEFEDTRVLSRDINLRVKCDSLGISAENYHKEKSVTVRREAFTGVSVIEMRPNEIDKFYSDGSIENEYDLEPNECVVLKGGAKSALAINRGGSISRLTHANAKGFSMEGVSPRNKEQRFASEMLLDEDIHMVSITGISGSGKTILSCASAIKQLNAKKYDKIILARPAQSTSADVGFLPGDLNEKLAPWLMPFFDNLEIIFKNGREYLNLLMEKGIIEVQALSHIRGRSLPRTILIIDEAQNITMHEAKAVITRMGEGSKLILLGDVEQIDAPHLDAATCGLGVVVEKFKNFGLSGHITLLKGERSELATHAAKVM
jgi:PhoH-like ATPase